MFTKEDFDTFREQSYPIPVLWSGMTLSGGFGRICKGYHRKTYIHSDGTKIYEIFNAAGGIMRVACAVHVRLSLWKLKETSEDAARVVYLFGDVFRKKRKWNDEEDMTDEKRPMASLCLTSGWNQSRFPWFIKESISKILNEFK